MVAFNRFNNGGNQYQVWSVLVYKTLTLIIIKWWKFSF